MGATGWVRIADLGPVEPDRLATSRKRPPDRDPLGRIAVLEVRVRERARELVEAPRRLWGVVAGIAAVTIDVLRPVVLAGLGIVVRPRAVVLRPALDLSWVRRVNGDADELQRVEVPVGVRDQVRYPGQQPLAVVQACRSEQRTLVRVAARGLVSERTIGADHPSIRALEDLGRVRRVDYDRVLVGVDVVRSPETLERRSDTAEGEFSVPERTPVGRLILRVVSQIGKGAGGGSTAGGRDGLGVAGRRRVQHCAPV